MIKTAATRTRRQERKERRRIRVLIRTPPGLSECNVANWSGQPRPYRVVDERLGDRISQELLIRQLAGGRPEEGVRPEFRSGLNSGQAPTGCYPSVIPREARDLDLCRQGHRFLVAPLLGMTTGGCYSGIPIFRTSSWNRGSPRRSSHTASTFAYTSSPSRPSYAFSSQRSASFGFHPECASAKS